MKLIDLLNKIAKGEEVPEKIKYNKKTYTRFRNSCGNTLYYYQVYGECDFLLQNIELVSELNDEVEILGEEKKDNFTGVKWFKDGNVTMSLDCPGEETEEDEFIDIDELKLISLEEFKRMNSAERYHITAIEYDKINDLIKNQKKIINKLKELN